MAEDAPLTEAEIQRLDVMRRANRLVLNNSHKLGKLRRQVKDHQATIAAQAAEIATEQARRVWAESTLDDVATGLTDAASTYAAHAPNRQFRERVAEIAREIRAQLAERQQ